MSEKLLRFLMLTEIKTVRLVCQNKDCEAIEELSRIDKKLQLEFVLPGDPVCRLDKLQNP